MTGALSSALSVSANLSAVPRGTRFCSPHGIAGAPERAWPGFALTPDPTIFPPSPARRGSPDPAVCLTVGLPGRGLSPETYGRPGGKVRRPCHSAFVGTRRSRVVIPAPFLSEHGPGSSSPPAQRSSRLRFNTPGGYPFLKQRNEDVRWHGPAHDGMKNMRMAGRGT